MRQPKTQRPVLQMRIAQPLMAELKKAAKKNGRSISSEAERRLERSFGGEERELDRLIKKAVRQGMAGVGGMISTALDLATITLEFSAGSLCVRIHAGKWADRIVSFDAFVESGLKDIPTLTNPRAVDDCAVALDELRIRTERLRGALLARLNEIQSVGQEAAG